MKYPVNAEQMIQAYSEVSGEEIDDTINKLYSTVTSLVNAVYEDGKKDALAEVKRI